MERSKVYFTDFRSTNGIDMPSKLKRLIRMAGIDKIDFEGKFVAIKMHFGEPGNVSFLRPNYARAVADVIRELGGRPFLTDCNTLYPGYRKNALDHIDAAQLNGFNEQTTGCHVIIADGLRGTDEALVPVKNGELVKEAKVGRALMDADIVISLTHFKGHEMAGFGGAIKNIGMGGGSRAGKMEQHSHGTPYVDQEKCRGCKQCRKHCGQNAISYGPDRKAHIDPELCAGCGRCIGNCNFDAIRAKEDIALLDLGRKMAEYTQAIVQDRPNFHISLIMDVSPCCDCCSWNDAPIIPNIGMLASFDPVALDQACLDLSCKVAANKNSVLGENMAKPDFVDYGDPFTNTEPSVEWKGTLAHGEKIGLGTREYELVTMK